MSALISILRMILNLSCPSIGVSTYVRAGAHELVWPIIYINFYLMCFFLFFFLNVNLAILQNYKKNFLVSFTIDFFSIKVNPLMRTRLHMRLIVASSFLASGCLLRAVCIGLLIVLVNNIIAVVVLLWQI